MKVIAILDKKKRLVRVIPEKVAVLDAKTHEVIGECQTSIEKREGETTKEVDLPDNWKELPKKDFSRKVAEKLFNN